MRALTLALLHLGCVPCLVADMILLLLHASAIGFMPVQMVVWAKSKRSVPTSLQVWSVCAIITPQHLLSQRSSGQDPLMYAAVRPVWCCTGYARFWLSIGRGSFGLSSTECPMPSFYVQAFVDHKKIIDHTVGFSVSSPGLSQPLLAVLGSISLLQAVVYMYLCPAHFRHLIACVLRWKHRLSPISVCSCMFQVKTSPVPLYPKYFAGLTLTSNFNNVLNYMDAEVRYPLLPTVLLCQLWHWHVLPELCALHRGVLHLL